MNCKKYSILMSVYYKERPEWLKMSIDSMLSQTIIADEFLIVKDGPLTPELDDILNEYSNKYPELFNIIELEENVGLGPALAIGIEKCRNEYVARMDSDDYSFPNRCEKLLEIFNENPEYAVVGSFEAEFENNINNIIAIHRVPETSDDIKQFMKRRCALLHPTVMYKKSIVINCGNYKDVRLYEDYDLFLRLVIQNEVKCYNIQESLYCIRINDGFFKRRGGISYLITSVGFKWSQYKNSYITIWDFIISGGSQAIVCLIPNFMRKFVYLKFLRK